MECTTSDAVQRVFEQSPATVRPQLLALRELILDAASEEKISAVDESLKWGQPSYGCKGGSTVRLGWAGDEKTVALYFHCQSRLVDTFKELYPTELRTEGNRALLFAVEDALPSDLIKHCVSLALTYHSRKHLPLLGA
ncbi:MAG: DUF1801 domain-containing protein [Granulosicoccaceae bacterium]